MTKNLACSTEKECVRVFTQKGIASKTVPTRVVRYLAGSLQRLIFRERFSNFFEIMPNP